MSLEKPEMNLQVEKLFLETCLHNIHGKITKWFLVGARLARSRDSRSIAKVPAQAMAQQQKPQVTLLPNFL